MSKRGTVQIDGVKYVKDESNYQTQINKVISNLGEDMFNALVESSAIIAGGAVLSAFTHQDTNDIDVYFRCKEDMARAFVAVTRDWDNIYLSHTDKSITLSDRNTGAIVQFIYFDYFKDAEAVFKAFDFTVCMGAIEFNSEGLEFVADPNFLSDVASRTLRFNRGTRYPYISLVRTKKYKERGYKISKGNLLGIALACAEYPITSWPAAKEQLGGVYGYEIELAIEADKEFNSENLFNVITAIKDDIVIKNVNYEEVYKQLTGEEYKR